MRRAAAACIESHRRDVGVEADADVLDVEHQDVDVAQHRLGRLPGRAVEAQDWHARPAITAVLDGRARFRRAAEPVLGREYGGQARSTRRTQQIQCDPRRRGRLVRDEPHARAVERRKPCRSEPFRPGDNGGTHGAMRDARHLGKHLEKAAAPTERSTLRRDMWGISSRRALPPCFARISWPAMLAGCGGLRATKARARIGDPCAPLKPHQDPGGAHATVGP